MTVKEKEQMKHQKKVKEKNMDISQESSRNLIDIGDLESPTYIPLSRDYNPDEEYGELN